MDQTTCTITFDENLLKLGKKDLRDGLSAVAAVDDALFLASDEATRIERLTRDGNGGFANHQAFPLKDLLGALPIDKEKEEVDIEGFAIDKGWLWLVGSHSAKRKKIDVEDDGTVKGTTAENIAEIAKVEAEGNRYLLARLPLDTSAGVPTPVAKAADGRRAGRLLPATDTGGAIVDALRGDPHIGPFVSIPGKDNGLDIEGLAVSGDRVYLGLRGPVIRGWAIVLELHVIDSADGSPSLVASGPDGALFVKHFLDLDGLGVRDLVVDGRDLIVLAGPTMVLDAPEIVYRWSKALDGHEPSLTWNSELGRGPDLPPVPPAKRVRGGPTSFDHAEGITFAQSNGTRSMLVIYDAPSDDRKLEPAGLTAGVVPVP